MKYLFITLIQTILFVSYSQTTMTIHMSTGSDYVIDVNDIDSINFTLTPPPETVNFYGISGNLFLPIDDIDSITYTISILQGVDIQTKAVTAVSNFSATSGGEILNDGGYTFFEKGIVWGQNPLPVLGQNYAISFSGTYDYTNMIQNLTPGTTYYVRAYAYAVEGIAYGPVLSFQSLNISTNHLNPVVTYGAIQDIDGNVYNTVVIGNQEWMAENLRTTSYANGDPIPEVSNASSWSTATIGAWANYDNQASYDYPLGKLYNGYAIMDDRQVCPSGWRLPRDFEFYILDDFYAGTSANALKSTDNSYWQTLGGSVTNESGFSALGSGYRMSGLGFADYGVTAQFWSETYNVTGAVDTSLHFMEFWESSDYMQQYEMNSNTVGRAVRCLRKIVDLDEVQLPLVSLITSTTANLSSNLFTNPIGSAPTVGFLWSTSPDPILTDNVLTTTLIGLSIDAQMTGLTPSTRYYVRAYSTNANGTSYGEVVTFLTLP